MQAFAEGIGGRKMVEEINHARRRFLATAIMTIASSELGMVGSSAAQSSKAPHHKGSLKCRPIIDTKVVYSCTRTQFRDFSWVCPHFA